MQKKWILISLVIFIVLLQPQFVLAADKPVSDCLNDDEDCVEETDGTETNEEDTQNTSEQLLGDNTMAPSSLALNIVKMVFALLLILALIYTLLWFLKKRRTYEKVGALENIGGISVGQQKSVQVVRIGDKMYLLGVGDNVELLKELSEVEAEKIQTDMKQSPPMPATSFLQNIFQKRMDRTSNDSENTEQHFNDSFQKELDKLKETRHQMVNYYGKKDDEHE